MYYACITLLAQNARCHLSVCRNVMEEVVKQSGEVEEKVRNSCLIITTRS